jgi:hypothetical protein
MICVKRAQRPDAFFQLFLFFLHQLFVILSFYDLGRPFGYPGNVEQDCTPAVIPGGHCSAVGSLALLAPYKRGPASSCCIIRGQLWISGRQGLRCTFLANSSFLALAGRFGCYCGASYWAAVEGARRERIPTIPQNDTIFAKVLQGAQCIVCDSVQIN